MTIGDYDPKQPGAPKANLTHKKSTTQATFAFVSAGTDLTGDILLHLLALPWRRLGVLVTTQPGPWYKNKTTSYCKQVEVRQLSCLRIQSNDWSSPWATAHR